MNSKKLTPDFKIYLIWCCGALFYMYQFVLRVSPAVIVKDLMISYSIDASAVASLSAMAMYSYSLLQIPSGLLADKFGVRKVILGSLLLCVIGTTLFATSSSLWVARLGRLIIGAGSSAAFLSGSKIAATYFPLEKRATLFGLMMACGTVGALNGGAPLAYLVSHLGWRTSTLALSAVGVFILVLTSIIFAAFGKKTSREVKGNTKISTHLIEVLTNFTVLKNAVVAIGLYLAVSVLADLWGPSLFMERFHVSKQAATESVSLIYVGLFIGSLAVPMISDFLKQRKLVTIVCVCLVAIFLSVVIYSDSISLMQASLLLFGIGFFSGAEMLCFAGAAEAVSVESAATVTGLVNGAVMFSAACIQHQVGWLLDYFWTGKFHESGVRLYSIIEYRQALSVMPIIVLVCCITAFYLKSHNQLSEKAKLSS